MRGGVGGVHAPAALVRCVRTGTEPHHQWFRGDTQRPSCMHACARPRRADRSTASPLAAGAPSSAAGRGFAAPAARPRRAARDRTNRCSFPGRIYRAVVFGAVSHGSAGRALLQEDLFHLMLNRRLAVVSRLPGCPFYVAQTATESLMATCGTHTCSIMPLPGKTLEALETALLEISRLRMHGAEPVPPPPPPRNHATCIRTCSTPSLRPQETRRVIVVAAVRLVNSGDRSTDSRMHVQRELEVAKMRYLTDYESLYLERDQVRPPPLPASSTLASLATM